MEDSNVGQCLQAQAEEIEVLCSIYGDEWKNDNVDSSYHIVLTEKELEVTLFISLPETYPFLTPPVYTLSAPKLSKEQKFTLTQQLEGVYLENIGQTVLFQWIEKIKEFLEHLPVEISNEVQIPDKVPEVLIHEYQLPEIIHGDTTSDRKSYFQGHCAKVCNVNQVRQILGVLKKNKKIANATHNIFAYRIAKEDTASFIQDCDDDGETQAGSRLLHLLQILNISDVLVVVSRWYGGIHLGPDRFRHINNSARQVLVQAGLISQEQKKKKS